jgi:N-acetylmuramoyl-L-alanine amidase
MHSIVRAAGFAAASLLAVIGTAYAAPGQVLEAAPVTSSFLDHLPASLPAEQSAESVAPSSQPAEDPLTAHEVTAPVAGTERPPIRSLSELVGAYATAETDGAEQHCLAGAVYFEAKGESLPGQLSVAEVVLNRSRSGRFPGTICGVVKQRGQFSFIRSGGFPPIARASLAWRKAVAIARIAMNDMADGPAPRALFFHATRVSPGWRGLTRVATVGNHIFYR